MKAKTPERPSTHEAAKMFSLPTDELLKRFADYNPRIHTDDDIQWTFASILEIGWATVICINEQTGIITGGHARTLAADYGRKLDRAWFDLKWEEWLSFSPDRLEIAEHHKPRFCPEFWESCPCIFVNLDDATERSTNIRLNNTAREGKNDPAKVAAMLAKLPERLQEHASYDKQTARSYIDAYLERKAVEAPPAPEFQAKQYFEREDATVYNSDGEEVPQHEIMAMSEIPPDWKVAIDGQTYDTDELEDFHQESYTPEDSGDFMTALDDLDLDALDEGFRCASVDKDVAETRIVILVSKKDVEEWRTKIPTIAAWQGIDITANPAKIWRPKAFMAMLRVAHTAALKAGQKEVVAPAAPEEDEED